MIDKSLDKLIKPYVSKNNPPKGFAYTSFGNFIPHEKLNNAEKSYAKYNITSEYPIMMFDSTISGSGKEGFLLTNLNFYYKMPLKWSGSSKAGLIPINDIKQFSLEIKALGCKLIMNNEQFAYTSLLNSSLRKEATVIADVMNIIIGNLNDAPSNQDNSVSSSKNSQSTESGGNTVTLNTLKEIKDLFDAGIISKEEFTSKKAELLKRL